MKVPRRERHGSEYDKKKNIEQVLYSEAESVSTANFILESPNFNAHSNLTLGAKEIESP